MASKTASGTNSRQWHRKSLVALRVPDSFDGTRTAFFATLKQVAYVFPRCRRFGKRVALHAQWIPGLGDTDVLNMQNVGSHVAHVKLEGPSGFFGR